MVAGVEQEECAVTQRAPAGVVVARKVAEHDHSACGAGSRGIDAAVAVQPVAEWSKLRGLSDEPFTVGRLTVDLHCCQRSAFLVEQLRTAAGDGFGQAQSSAVTASRVCGIPEATGEHELELCDSGRAQGDTRGHALDSGPALREVCIWRARFSCRRVG